MMDIDKPQINWSPYLLILSGPLGSGKSSVAVKLWKTMKDHPAYIDLDMLKSLIWPAPADDHHLDLASLNACSIAKNYLDKGHSVIIDKAFGKFDFVRPFVEIGLARGIPVHYVKFTAPLETLLDRNRKRLSYTYQELAEQARWRCYSADDAKVTRVYDFFLENAHNEGIEINTATSTLDEVVERVRNIICS
jgi:predicted kinase